MAKKAYKGQLEAVSSNYKPTISLDLSEDDLPAIKNWRVGKSYNLVLKVKQVSHRISSYDKKMSAGFEVTSVAEEEKD